VRWRLSTGCSFGSLLFALFSCFVCLFQRRLQSCTSLTAANLDGLTNTTDSVAFFRNTALGKPKAEPDRP
jgi:hypothetical protein